jgi:hypothetical protein
MAASPVGLDDWRRSNGPALVGSVQFRLNRFLFLEGEATRWTAVEDIATLPGISQPGSGYAFVEHRDRDVLTIGTNLLFRGGTSRVTAFAGAGLGVRSAHEEGWYSITCPPGPGTPTICTGAEFSRPIDETSTGLTEQFVVGGELWITRRLAAYGGARFAFANDDFQTTAGFAPLAGVRVAVRSAEVVRPAGVVRDDAAPGRLSRAQGKDVRVTLKDGTKHRGKLEAVGTAEVAVGTTGIPLAEVQKIEEVGHATRNAVAIGFLALLPAALFAGQFDLPSDMVMGIIGAGIGAGIGVGVVIDAVKKPGNVVYVAPRASASFNVRPILTTDRKGVAFAARW